MAEPRKLTPAEEARLAQVREQFKQKQDISKSLNSIKYRIGVYSGKGGVGKTTVTTNLALILAKHGKKVAILDCDIDCPNVTRVLRISNTKSSPQMSEISQKSSKSDSRRLLGTVLWPL